MYIIYRLFSYFQASDWLQQRHWRADDRVTRLATPAVEDGLPEAVQGAPLAGCVPFPRVPLDAGTANPPPIAVRSLPSNWVPSRRRCCVWKGCECAGIRLLHRMTSVDVELRGQG
jgi:hypothetical protein